MLDGTHDRKNQTKERTVYDREFLLQCRTSPLANEMPLELQIIDDAKEHGFWSFINPEVSIIILIPLFNVSVAIVLNANTY